MVAFVMANRSKQLIPMVGPRTRCRKVDICGDESFAISDQTSCSSMQTYVHFQVNRHLQQTQGVQSRVRSVSLWPLVRISEPMKKEGRKNAEKRHLSRDFCSSHGNKANQKDRLSEADPCHWSQQVVEVSEEDVVQRVTSQRDVTVTEKKVV